MGILGAAQEDSLQLHHVQSIHCRTDRLKGPCHLSRDDHGLKIMTRKQNTDIGKYSSVNRTIKLLNKLPAEVIAAFFRKSHVIRKR